MFVARVVTVDHIHLVHQSGATNELAKEQSQWHLGRVAWGVCIQ